jgi:ribosome-binding ATPase
LALEVGIVGLQSSGKSLLFEALTGSPAQNEVGMAAIPDPRLQQLADIVKAKKVTPAGVRVVEVRGTSCWTASPARVCRPTISRR